MDGSSSNNGGGRKRRNSATHQKGYIVRLDQEQHSDFALNASDLEDGAGTSEKKKLVLSKKPQPLIQIGKAFQPVIPKLIEDCKLALKEVDKDTCIWKPTTALSAQDLKHYVAVSKQKFGFGEDEALGLLLWSKYDRNLAYKQFQGFAPSSEPPWTAEEELLFQKLILSFGKRFNVYTGLFREKSVSQIIRYYYDVWKVNKLKIRNAHANAKNKLSLPCAAPIAAKDQQSAPVESSGVPVCAKCNHQVWHPKPSPIGNLCSSCYETLRMPRGAAPQGQGVPLPSGTGPGITRPVGPIRPAHLQLPGSSLRPAGTGQPHPNFICQPGVAPPGGTGSTRPNSSQASAVAGSRPSGMGHAPQSNFIHQPGLARPSGTGSVRPGFIAPRPISGAPNHLLSSARPNLTRPGALLPGGANRPASISAHSPKAALPGGTGLAARPNLIQPVGARPSGTGLAGQNFIRQPGSRPGGTGPAGQNFAPPDPALFPLFSGQPGAVQLAHMAQQIQSLKSQGTLVAGAPKSDVWTPDDMKAAVFGLRWYGNDLSSVAAIVRTKTADQIKKFFAEQHPDLYKKIMAEFENERNERRTHGEVEVIDLIDDDEPTSSGR